jgi:serine/threonine protein kinase
MQEYCNGAALRAVLQSGALTPKQLSKRFRPIMYILKGIAQGMQYIQSRGFCHGDLNPANILLKVFFPSPALAPPC